MRYLFPYLTAAVLVLTAQGCKGGNAAPEKEVTPPKGSTVSVSVFPDRVLTTSRLQLSTTLTHKTFQYPKNTQAVSRAESMLREGVDCIGQFTMDWGAGNTNPSKDTYDFRRLDERVRLIRRLGKKVVLTLCRCPQWMRRDDPSKGVDAAPRADMYEEFAHMAADFLRHYRDLDLDIYAVNVWSETRGYWSKDLGRWLLEDYADLYNTVYDSLKKVQPAVLVGGPFMHIESSPKGRNMATCDGSISASDRKALEAFLGKARAMDFFSIDRNLMENSDTTPYTPDEVLRYTGFNSVVHAQVREILESRFPDTPVWVVDNQCLKGHFAADVEAAGLASMYRHHLLGGAAFVDKWQPEDEGSERTDTQQIAPEGMYTHTDTADGAQPLPTFYVFKAFRECFPPGTAIVESNSSSEWVETLASSRHLMLINKHSKTHEVTIQAGSKTQEVTLQRFEVKILEL